MVHGVGADSEQFKLATERRGHTLYLRFAGEIDLARVGTIERALNRYIRADVRLVVLDLSAVTFIDCAALGTIIRAHERTLTEPFEMVVVRPQGFANHVFTLTSAEDQLTMVDRAPEPVR